MISTEIQMKKFFSQTNTKKKNSISLSSKVFLVHSGIITLENCGNTK